MSDPLWLDILRWALAGLAAWLVLGTLVALAVGRCIAAGEREQARHVAKRATRLRARIAAAKRAEIGARCRPGRPCRSCNYGCAAIPCCPHCPWDPTNDQM